MPIPVSWRQVQKVAEPWELSIIHFVFSLSRPLGAWHTNGLDYVPAVRRPLTCACRAAHFRRVTAGCEKTRSRHAREEL